MVSKPYTVFNRRKKHILFIILWVLSGLLAVLLGAMIDLRGEEFNSNYFNSEICGTTFIIFLGGMFSLFIISLSIFVVKIEENGKSINYRMSELFYKIANIGLDKNNNNMKSITNVERLSNLLTGGKDCIDSRSDEIWNMTKLNDEFEDYHQLRDWMKKESK